MDRTMNPTAFMEFDFAWKAVKSREPVQAYLDYSSPWLFPAMLLARRRCDSAVLLSSDAPGLEVLERLAEGPRNGRSKPVCDSISDTILAGESFDLITSLSWLARAADDIRTLKALWSALKPGGMLVLSLPCASQSAEHLKTIPSAPSNVPKTYDESMLEDRVFAVIGQPRRSVVYGESKADMCRATAEATNKHFPLRRYVDIGRRWRTYPALRDLAGEGVIAMKFVKPEVNQRGLGVEATAMNFAI
jgi:SAM-dependent methyltransferase